MRGIGVNVSGARSSAVGAAHGIAPGDLKEIEARVRSGHRTLQKARREKRLGFFDLHRDRAAIRAIRERAGHFKRFEYDNFVVLGIGGSALGVTTLVTALLHPYHNLRSRTERKGAPRVFVMDNVDPGTFSAMLEVCPPENTFFNVISKSGGTGETVAQLLVVLGELEKRVGRAAVNEHVVLTTGPSKPRGKASPLAQLGRAYGLKSLDVPENVGGRFSVFSPVGMFPAAMLGMDLDALYAGCAAMDARCRTASLKENPAYLRAAMQYLLSERKGKRISVMMPYSDGLRDVADWYRQIWAESLGKRFDRAGAEVYTGQTPVKALGATDQHSQLQLYLEGPNDKAITILEERVYRRRLPISMPERPPDGVDYLRAKTMGALLTAERKATVDALQESARPVMRVTLDRVNAHTVAQLLYMLEVETAMAGELFGIDAFDQPAVERIKVLTRAYMGKKS